MARGPKTGTPVSIGARYAPHFKPKMRLRERVDQGLETSNPDVFADGGCVALESVCRTSMVRHHAAFWLSLISPR